MCTGKSREISALQSTTKIEGSFFGRLKPHIGAGMVLQGQSDIMAHLFPWFHQELLQAKNHPNLQSLGKKKTVSTQVALVVAGNSSRESHRLKKQTKRKESTVTDYF